MAPQGLVFELDVRPQGTLDVGEGNAQGLRTELQSGPTFLVIHSR